MRSAIFKGSVWHQRFQPTEHSFRYRVFMMYLDLAEQDVVLGSSRLWGTKWYHLARFKRSDYFTLNGDTTQSIDDAVRQEVGVQLGERPTGPVCLLTNFRYCGYNTNPIMSPFMPMNRVYRWRGSMPAETLRYSLASVVKSIGGDGTDEPHTETGGEMQFDSGVVFKRVPVTGSSLNKVLLSYPLMTLKVILAIYWQALKLWIKKIPFVSHPSKSEVSSEI